MPEAGPSSRRTEPLSRRIDRHPAGRLILPGEVRLVGEILLVTAAYYATARLSLSLALVREQVTPIWPPTGIALVALLVFGRRCWPGITLAALLVNLPIGPSRVAAVVIATGNTIAPLVAAHLLEKVGFRRALDRLRDAIAIVFLGALGGMLVSATVGSLALLLFDGISAGAFWPTWSVWWVGDAMGVLVVAPFLLTFGVRSRDPRPAGSWRRRAEAAAVFGAIAVVAYVVFQSTLRLEYVVFPLLAWAAWRFHQRGAAPAALLATGIAVWAAAEGTGPFGHGTLFGDMVVLQVFNSSAAFASFVFASLVAERARGRESLESAAQALEDRVHLRTQQLAEAQRIAHIGSWEWNILADAVSWSDEMYRMWGLDPAQATRTYQDYLDRVHPADRSLANQTIQRAYAECTPFSFDHRVIHSDGTVRWVHGRGRVITDSDGRPIRMTGTAQDVTDRKLAEGRVLASEKELREFIDNLSTFTAKVGLDGTVLLVGKAAEIASGLSHDELMRTNFLEGPWWTFDPDVHARVREAFRTATAGEPVSYDEQLFVLGQVLTISFSLVPVRDESGLVIYVLAEGRDITALKKAEAKFQGLLEAAPDATIGVDRSGTIRLVNRQAEILFGFRRSELVGQPVETLVPDRFGELQPDKHASHFAGPPDWPVTAVEVNGKRQDGTEFPAAISLSTVETAEGPMVIAAIRDVSRRRSAEEALERLAAIVHHSDDAIFSRDVEGTIVSWNAAAERLFGFTEKEAIGQPVSLIVPHDRVREVEEILDHVARDEAVEHFDTVRMRKDGTSVNVSLTVSAHRDAAGRVVGASTIARDITERKRAEEALERAEERFRSAFDNAPIGMALVDLGGRFLRVNRSLCELLGRPEQQLLGSTMAAITHPDDVTAAARTRQRMLAGKAATYLGEQAFFHADGHSVSALVGISLLLDSESRPLHFITQIQDVTAAKEAEARLAHQALHDPLTGLPNRKLFMDRLDQALARSYRRSSWVAVLFLDLDNFKDVNDSLGHDAGDQALMVLAKRIQGALRSQDTAGRFGGDEFVVLCEDLVSGDEAIAIADRIAEAIAPPFSVNGRDLEFTASMGIALASGVQSPPSQILRQADTAMYRAKEGGRNRYEVFDDAMRLRVTRRLETEASLRQALAQSQFHVRYQPQVSLQTGKVVGLEALVRWQHPERGLIYPSEFITVAEDSGLIVPLGAWVLETACRESLTWPNRQSDGLRPMLAVNLSPRQLSHPGLVETISRYLTETGIQPASLCLEITETALLVATEATLRALQELKEMGLLFGIDDFGTGYSSLTYLSQFHPDVLKVDRFFIERLDKDAESSAIVEAVISLAHSLGLVAIAEGVETEEQLRRLQDLGCDWAQGFLFAPPEPSDVARRLLKGAGPARGLVQVEPKFEASSRA